MEINNNELPLISVLIFAYNHEDYIEQTIKSVIDQKCSFSYEILISDDFSTDKTLNIIKKYQIKRPDLVKIIANKQNLGLNTTFINAVKKAKGNFLAILGGDDYWIINNKLEMEVQLLLSNKEIFYVHTEFKTFNESTKKITNHCNKNWHSVLMEKKGKKALIEMLCHNWSGYPLSSSSCFRKAPLLKGINNHPEILDYNLVGEGTIIHSSMTYYGGLYAFIPIQTAMYRIRKESLSHYKTKIEQFNYQKKYFLLRLFTAKTYELNKNEIKKIHFRGMLNLYQTALGLNTINEFQIFQKTQNTGIWIDIIIYISKFIVFRVVYKITRKFRSKIKKILRNLIK